MAASSNLKKNYHVFLSFRGTDVRGKFLSHLYEALNQKGIHAFMDSEELKKGEKIEQALERAIKESRIAIVLFSKNYASSTWCLDEVAKIMECMKQKDLIVFPVFYKVEPREVRTPRKNYKKDMDKHERKFGKNSEKVQRWKKALLDAGELSGWGFHDGDEAELIQCIVTELSTYLNRTLLHVADHPVGIDSQIQKLILLSQEESEDVLMIGLWGPGGIGKTTIAKAMYNAIWGKFDGSSFLERVRETSEKWGLHYLQQNLLSQILPRNNIRVHSESEGINLIEERLCHKKVLLVLDDVDQKNQLEALAGKSNSFGKGSRIIVTSRDEHLLTSGDIKYVHKVEALQYHEARALFCWHAFPYSEKDEIGIDLINRALHYAKGLPLALKVLGSFLCKRKKLEWADALNNFSEVPDEGINKVLKISYNGLDKNQKGIFLDMACFFKGKSIEYVREVLESCGFKTTIGIQVLIERSLITIENGTLQMHDLIQLMGMDIVKQVCPNDPQQCSRLWLFKDVLDVLHEETETNAVEAIVLDLPAPNEITISPHAFANMKMLRMLILVEVRISSLQGPVHLPRKLRWLQWPNAPNLEFGPDTKELVGLDVQKSHIKQIGGNFRKFGELKSINFSQCKSLASVPDFSSVQNLESLNLYGCESLVEVDQSIGYLGKLKFLSLESCSNLCIFPKILKTKSLHTLKLSGCSKLDNFPDVLEEMEHLEELDLERTAIKQLPISIENLVSIKIIRLRYCKSLTTLPLSIYKLQNLESLSLQDCSNFVMFPKNSEDSNDSDGNQGFPNLYRLELDGCNLSKVEFLENFSNFPKLAFLYLSKNNFSHMPTCINKYNDLEHLHVDKCKQLLEIPQLPSNILTLRANGCESLQKLPVMSSLSSNFLEVDLSSCCELFSKGVNIADVLSLEQLPKMRTIDILLPGREMPEWLLPCKREFIIFMVPQDLNDKFLGLALCVVLGLEEGKVVDASCEVEVFVNGQSVIWQSTGLYTLEFDHVWLQYIPRSMLRKVEKTLQNAGSNFQVCLRASKGSLKECGFRLICEKKEDDLRVMLQDY